MKTIISTGLGRLHLVQSARALSKAGVDVRLVQGWIPKKVPVWLLNLFGRLVGSRNLASGMAKRRPAELPDSALHSCAVSEFRSQALFKLSRLGMLRHGRAARLSWEGFGRCSVQYLNDADIFHVRSGAGRGGAIDAARQNGSVIITNHTIAHPGFMEDALRDEYERYELPFWGGEKDEFWAWVLQDCIDSDVLLVNSDFVKKTFVERGFCSDRIEVVTQGVREDFFSLKHDYQVKRRVELLFTGGWGIRKGAHYLIKALELLECSGLNAHLTVVGSGEEGIRLADGSPVRDRITYVGPVPQERLAEYFRKADVYVFPSLAEGCASSGLEAMGAGLPVIATLESGLPIGHEENGLIVDSKSADAIAGACSVLYAHRGLRKHIGQLAARTIQDGYTWPAYAKKLLDVYERSLNRQWCDSRSV